MVVYVYQHVQQADAICTMGLESLVPTQGVQLARNPTE